MIDRDRRFSAAFMLALPFIALGFGGPRPLHDVPGHEFIGVAIFVVALLGVWRLVSAAHAQEGPASHTRLLAGGLLVAPWMLIGLLWTGIGAPFQSTAPENLHRFVLLMVNALLVGAGFIVLAAALRERGERLVGTALVAASIPANAMYLFCIALTLANATLIVAGDHTRFPPLLDHLYDALEFFACVLTYGCTVLAAVALGRARLLGPVCVRVFVVIAAVALALLVMRGIEYPEISGRTEPWYVQPGVIVRIPAIPWVMPGMLGALLLRRRIAA